MKFPIKITNYQEMTAYTFILNDMDQHSYLEGPGFMVTAEDLPDIFDMCPSEQFWLHVPSEAVGPRKGKSLRKRLAEYGLLRR